MSRNVAGASTRYRMKAAEHIPRTLDKFSFFFIFLVGAIGIVALKSRFGVWHGYVIAWSAGWMIVYLMMVSFVPRYRLRPDQAGDNLYYLGFLYTLVSLSVALYFFSDADAALEQTISNFGIALATTILGIALRVVLHQMREDPIDTEREARLSLAEAATRLRVELDSSVQQMSIFTREMRQSVEEALHELGTKASGFLQESGVQVAEVTKNASQGIQDAFSAYAEQAKLLNAASRRQVQVTEKLVERIEAIEVPADLIERKIAPAVEQIAALTDEIAKRQRLEGQTLEEIGEIVAGLRRSGAEIEKQTAAMRDSVEAASASARGLAPIIRSLEEVSTTVVAAGASVTKLTETQTQAAASQAAILQEQVATVTRLRESMTHQLENFEAQLGQMREASGREIIAATRELTERHGEAYAEFARQASESLAALERSRVAMEQEVARARAATEEVMRQLASMVRALGSELDSERAQRREAAGS